MTGSAGWGLARAGAGAASTGGVLGRGRARGAASACG